MPPRLLDDMEGCFQTLRAKCPFCGEQNIFGPAQEKRPGEPTATTQTCPHFAFISVTSATGAEYVHREFYLEVGNVRGGLQP
jgi:hypothetical protein